MRDFKIDLTHFANSSTKYLNKNASPILMSRDDRGRSDDEGGRCCEDLVPNDRHSILDLL